MKRKSSMRRYVWFVLGAVILAALAWALWPAPITVEVAQCERGDLASTVGGEGKAQVTQRYVVSAPVDGELERIEAQPGDPIARDTVIARIRPIASRPLDLRSRAEAVAQVRGAQAAIARADAAQAEAAVALEHAASLRESTQILASTGAIASSQAEHAGHEAEMRRHAVDETIAAARQARADLARAQAVLAPGTEDHESIAVAAPTSGQILRVVRDNAGPITAGTPLLEMGDASRLEAVADLLSVDAALVHTGAAAKIAGWGTKQELRARVRRVDPAAFTKVSALGLEEQRVHVVLDLTEPVPPGLGHDYRVDVSIVVWQGKGVLRIPSVALFRSGDLWTVFSVRKGRARLVPVETGPSDGKWTVVQRGLAEGETVIVQPSDQIRDGARVRP